MVLAPSVTGSTIAYHLRHHKAIERNLFLNLLKLLNLYNKIDLKSYRYVGFGAAFLEDFKALHSEFGILQMDCVEMDKSAFSRQNFNNPYNFIQLYPVSSTVYINEYFKSDLNQIIWWDFAAPKDLRQQLQDIQLTGEKVQNLDILKFTFNAEEKAFPLTKRFVYGKSPIDYKKVLESFKKDATFSLLFPETISANDIEIDLTAVIRAMALRAVRRGIAKSNPELYFHHLASFSYADGQKMTTVTGIVCKKGEIEKIVLDCSLDKWDFYNADTANELIAATDISVPVMTVAERARIDKLLHLYNPKKIAEMLEFQYGTNNEEHDALIQGYCKFYRYLPYFTKVII